MLGNPLVEHRDTTKKLALSLNKLDIYHWLINHGYFPENYVLPPCFKVVKSPQKPKVFFKPKKRKFKPDRTECVSVHFPKTDFTDRNFGIIDPRIHNDIAFHIARNWKTIVRSLFPPKSRVQPISKKPK